MDLVVLNVSLSVNDRSILVTCVLRDATTGAIQGTVHFSVAIPGAAWQALQTFLDANTNPVKQRLTDLASRFGATRVIWGV